MTEHLLLIAIGPVQDFIAQARRTRDLWHGSHLISELSRVVAGSIAADGGNLLIPALDHEDRELEPCWSPLRPTTGMPPEAVANKIWALIPPEKSPQAIAGRARELVQKCLREQAAAVWAKVKKLLPPDVEQVWDGQIDDALEFAAGWIAFDGRAFNDIRAELDDAVTARKRLRDFRPVSVQRGGVPKSSLDGARESVLPRRSDKRRRGRLQRQFGLAESEELDAVGLLKRAGADPEQFIPIVNVALAPWLAWAAECAPTQFEACRVACEKLKVQHITTPMLCDGFRFDASVMLPSRWPALERELGWTGEEHVRSWEGLQAAIKRLHAKVPSPNEGPYVACIVADGDRMGDTINQIEDPAVLRGFSHHLSAFASSARSIVKAHQGSLVYAGGDDVLAFTPVSTAVECAQALRHEFETVVGEACSASELNSPGASTPSLSVGIGIGHYMQSMGELLELGREAEALAKGKLLDPSARRNSLAIVVDKRSGGRRVWRMRWPSDPLARLNADRTLLGKLSTKKIHEVAQLLQGLPQNDNSLTEAEELSLSRLIELEVSRSLARNEAGAMSLDAVGLQLPSEGYTERRESVRAWIDRLLIARELQRAGYEPRTHGGTSDAA